MEETCISKGRMATLLGSTFASLPIYFLSLLHILRSVHLSLDEIQMNFLLRGRNLKKKPHLVMAVTCLNRKSGVLVVKDLGKLS